MMSETSKTFVIRCLGFVLVFAIFVASVRATTTTVNTNTPLPVTVPDNNTNFTCINFPVTGIPSNEIVSNVSVTFGFEHPCVLDMQVELRDPSGARVRQLFGSGLMGLCTGDGSFDIAGSYSFTDAATIIMNQQQDVFAITGNYHSANYNSVTPTSLNALFSGMTGLQANGNWQLCGRDISEFDIGRFKTAASITITSFAPTGSRVSVSGQVLSQFGYGITGATVMLTDQWGISRSVKTNPFGYFRFDNVEVGQTYVVSVSGKEHQFSQQIVMVSGDIAGLRFTAQ
jgi:subtilisin-like proprotein convertase family protein